MIILHTNRPIQETMKKILLLIGILAFSNAVCICQTKEEYKELGAVWAKKGEHLRAIMVYNEAIDKFNYDAELYILRGEQKWMSGKTNPEMYMLPIARNSAYNDALLDYNRAISLDETSCHGYYARGSLYFNYQMYDEAIKDFSKQLQYEEVEENKHKAYESRAMARLCKGEYDGAMEDCNKAMVINPKDFGVYTNIAHIYRAQKNYAKANEFLKKALAIDSTQTILWNNIEINFNLRGLVAVNSRAKLRLSEESFVIPKLNKAYKMVGFIRVLVISTNTNFYFKPFTSHSRIFANNNWSMPVKKVLAKFLFFFRYINSLKYMRHISLLKIQNYNIILKLMKHVLHLHSDITNQLRQAISG